MHARKLMTQSALASAVLMALSGSAFAAGFQASEHSAADVGRAFAGEGVIAEDASVQAANAAGLAFLKGSVYTGSWSRVDPSIKVKGTYTGALAPTGRPAEQSDMTPTIDVPAMYFASQINDQWHWGVGAFTNFGLVTNYSGDFGGSALADRSDLKTANLNLNFAYQVNPRVAVGFGINAVRAEANLTSRITSPTPLTVAPGVTVDLGGKRIADMDGTDWGYGWNIGVVAEPVDGTRVGLSYRSQVNLKLDGKVRSDVYNGVGLPQNPLNPYALNYNTDASVKIELPSIIEASFNQVITPDWSVQAMVQNVDWDTFEKLEFDLNNGQPFPTTQEKWNSTWRYSLGTTYKLNPDWTLRAGIMKDESPVKDEYRTLRIPDSDRTWYTVGAGWQVTNALSVDAAYAYLDGDKASLNETSAAGHFSGEMTGHAQVFSVQANYRF